MTSDIYWGLTKWQAPRAALFVQCTCYPYDLAIISISQMGKGKLKLLRKLADSQVTRKWWNPEHRQNPGVPGLKSSPLTTHSSNTPGALHGRLRRHRGAVVTGGPLRRHSGQLMGCDWPFCDACWVLVLRYCGITGPVLNSTNTIRGIP